MTRQELEIKAKDFNSKLKRHPMSDEELQIVLCDFVESLQKQPISVRSGQLLCSLCGHPLKEHSKGSNICPTNITQKQNESNLH